MSFSAGLCGLEGCERLISMCSSFSKRFNLRSTSLIKGRLDGSEFISQDKSSEISLE